MAGASNWLDIAPYAAPLGRWRRVRPWHDQGEGWGGEVEREALIIYLDAEEVNGVESLCSQLTKRGGLVPILNGDVAEGERG